LNRILCFCLKSSSDGNPPIHAFSVAGMTTIPSLLVEMGSHQLPVRLSLNLSPPDLCLPK
jgi:hypothetical protein